MAVQSDRIQLKRGETQDIEFHLITADSYWGNESTPADWVDRNITDETLIFTCKLSIKDPDNSAIFTKVNKPGEHSDPTHGKTIFVLTTDETLSFPVQPSPCQYAWELWLIDANGDKFASQRGTLEVQPSLIQDISAIDIT